MGPTSGGSVPTTASSSSASTSNNARRGQSALKVVYGSNQRTASTPATTSSLSLPNIKSGQAPSGLNQAPAQVNATGQLSQAGANQRVMRSSTSTPVDTKGSGLFKFVAYKTPADGYGIQLGVYADYRTVLEQANQLAQSNIQDIMIHATNDGQKDLFRMIVGPFSNRGSAENFKQQLTSIGKQGFIVVLQDLN
jgi:cell division septation protein DedD